MIEIAKAGQTDAGWLLREDDHVGEPWISRCIELGEYLVARLDGKPVGFLRFSCFWGRIPYMEMIRVLPECRRTGIGTALFRHWEDEMRSRGSLLLMTSSEADEPAPQAWHRRNGFLDAGSINLPGIQAVPEVFLIKQIG